MEPRHFTATVAAAARGRVVVPVPFDPDALWGTKSAHHVVGTVGGRRVRAVIETLEDGRGIVLGPAWLCDRDVSVGDVVDVVLAPEGPQRDDLDDDIAAALAADPIAGAFFDALAQFYRRAYLTWIDGTKRRPEVRAERIAHVVAWLAAGIKERPR